MSPFTNFFKKAGRSVGNFFKKDIAKPAQHFFKRGGQGEHILGGISRGFSTAGSVANRVANSPLIQAGLTAYAPELAPVIQPLSGLAGKSFSILGDATNIKNYKGQSAPQIGRNVLERAKQLNAIGKEAKGMQFQ